MIVQGSLFDLAAQRPPKLHPCGCALDPRSEDLLACYRGLRLANGGHPRTVAREVSQLRSLVRELGTTAALPDVFRDAATLARLLLEPNVLISASTGRCRLVAAQQFVHLCGGQVGIAEVERFLRDLDSLLPARSRCDWHSAGTIVAGTRSRRRPLGVTLDPADLERIVSAVTSRSAARERWDRALVALHCYSGLRPDGLGALRWSDMMADPESEHVSIQLRRDSRWLRLLVAGPAVGPLLAWQCIAADDAHRSGEQYVFPRGARGPEPVTPRAARNIVRQACQRAGFLLATATDLRAAFACWLRARGLSDHESAAILGLQQVRSLDRLLARHRALDAQRRVREVRLPHCAGGAAPARSQM